MLEWKLATAMSASFEGVALGSSPVEAEDMDNVGPAVGSSTGFETGEACMSVIKVGILVFAVSRPIWPRVSILDMPSGSYRLISVVRATSCAVQVSRIVVGVTGSTTVAQSPGVEEVDDVSIESCSTASGSIPCSGPGSCWFSSNAFACAI